MGKLHPTNIQWCTHTVNPVVAMDRATGKQGWACTKVATGCMHCYAEALNVGRFGTGHPFDVASESLVEWQLDEAALQSVLRRQKSATIFWCDMTDLFHERVPDKWVDQCFAVMALTPHLRHIVLTKRPERMREYVEDMGRHYKAEVDGEYMERWGDAAVELTDDPCAAGSPIEDCGWPLPNVAIGTSVANQEDADRNIPHLLNTPAALRFVSYEPAIAEVDWGRYLWSSPRPDIDAIIIGGESGSNARPFDIAWARNTIAQCEEAGVVAMVKQLGSHPGNIDRVAWQGHTGALRSRRLRDSHGGDPSEWPEDLRPYAASVEKWPL
jgi:protein gp37